MRSLDGDLKTRIEALKRLPVMPTFGVDLDKHEIEMITKVVEVAVWIHHKIVYIHPFVDGNGRAARLMGNLILERFRLIGISIKVERENKNRYRAALQQGDKMGDCGPLEDYHH